MVPEWVINAAGVIIYTNNKDKVKPLEEYTAGLAKQEMEELDHFRKKIREALKIPSAFIGADYGKDDKEKQEKQITRVR